MADPTRKPPPCRARLVELLDYDPGTGIFIWKRRVETDGRIRLWNRKHAGKTAGVLYSKGYVGIKLDGVRYAAHRLAWFYVHDEWPNLLDHDNFTRNDNSIGNLKVSDHSKNGHKRGVKAVGANKYKGVRRQKNRWRASIGVEGKRINLGAYSTPENAAEAYRLACIQYFGEFASPGYAKE